MVLSISLLALKKIQMGQVGLMLVVSSAPLALLAHKARLALPEKTAVSVQLAHKGYKVFRVRKATKVLQAQLALSPKVLSTRA
jgi:hypothetical protein